MPLPAASEATTQRSRAAYGVESDSGTGRTRLLHGPDLMNVEITPDTCSFGPLVPSHGAAHPACIQELWRARPAHCGAPIRHSDRSHSFRSPAVVTCPNLSAFEPAALRSIGVQKTGAQFSGYFCSVRQAPDPVPERTNLEIV